MALKPNYDVLGLLAEFPTHITPIQTYAQQRSDTKGTDGNLLPEELLRQSTARDRIQKIKDLATSILTSINQTFP